MSIDGFIQQDKQHGGKLYKALRRGHRQYRKGCHAKRVIIPNRIGIEHRPAVVDEKARLGDWEADTVLGKQGTGAIVSLVERKSKIYLIRKVPAKSAADVSRAMIGMLWQYRRHVHTITADNSSEFCDHQTVSRQKHRQNINQRIHFFWGGGRLIINPNGKYLVIHAFTQLKSQCS